MINEKSYHNKIANIFNKTRKNDYLWQIPEEKYFKSLIKYSSTILDIGCGPSIAINNLLPNKFSGKYIGVDISRKMIEFAKKNYPKGKFFVSSFDVLPKECEECNIFLSLGSLHHSTNQINTFSYWINKLPNNGYLLLREPLLEALIKGKGASPEEEGINLKDINQIIIKYNIKLLKKVYFCSKFIHFFNKIYLKIKCKNHKLFYILWKVFYDIDIALCNSLPQKFIKAEAIILILYKP